MTHGKTNKYMKSLMGVGLQSKQLNLLFTLASNSGVRATRSFILKEIRL